MSDCKWHINRKFALLVKSTLHLSNSVVEVRIELVNDTLVLDDLQFNRRKDHPASNINKCNFNSMSNEPNLHNRRSIGGGCKREKTIKTRNDIKTSTPNDSEPPERRSLDQFPELISKETHTETEEHDNAFAHNRSTSPRESAPGARELTENRRIENARTPIRRRMKKERTPPKACRKLVAVDASEAAMDGREEAEL